MGHLLTIESAEPLPDYRCQLCTIDALHVSTFNALESLQGALRGAIPHPRLPFLGHHVHSRWTPGSDVGRPAVLRMQPALLMHSLQQARLSPRIQAASLALHPRPAEPSLRSPRARMQLTCLPLCFALTSFHTHIMGEALTS